MHWVLTYTNFYINYSPRLLLLQLDSQISAKSLF